MNKIEYSKKIQLNNQLHKINSKKYKLIAEGGCSRVYLINNQNIVKKIFHLENWIQSNETDIIELTHVEYEYNNTKFFLKDYIFDGFYYWAKFCKKYKNPILPEILTIKTDIQSFSYSIKISKQQEITKKTPGIQLKQNIISSLFHSIIKNNKKENIELLIDKEMIKTDHYSINDDFIRSLKELNRTLFDDPITESLRNKIIDLDSNFMKKGSEIIISDPFF
jgi:hypothetical protein